MQKTLSCQRIHVQGPPMTLFNFEEVYILYHYVPLLLACWGCGYVMFFF